MTPRPGEHVRPLLGAFALGHLDDDEATAVRAHLDGCPACREEAELLAPVAALLPMADPERLGATVEPPRAMLDGVLRRIHDERTVRDRARRRSMLGRVGAAAAALAVVLAVAVVVLQATEQAPSGEVVALTAAEAGVEGEAVIHADPRSTWVELTTSGLSAGETYAVWLEESTGDRSPMGTFTGVEGDLYISLYSTLPRARAASIGVSATDGSVVMQGNIPAPVAS
jgi:anti-sigma-K factor RskA